MTPAGRRTKGHNFERKVARDLRRFFPEAKRGYQTRGGTREAPDVDGTPWYIECKDQKRADIEAAYAQAFCGSDTRAPMAITKRTGSRRIDVTLSLEALQKAVPEGWEELVVSISYDDFLELLEERYAARNT